MSCVTYTSVRRILPVSRWLSAGGTSMYRDTGEASPGVITYWFSDTRCATRPATSTARTREATTTAATSGPRPWPRPRPRRRGAGAPASWARRGRTLSEGGTYSGSVSDDVATDPGRNRRAVVRRRRVLLAGHRGDGDFARGALTDPDPTVALGRPRGARPPRSPHLRRRRAGPRRGSGPAPPAGGRRRSWYAAAARAHGSPPRWSGP